MVLLVGALGVARQWGSSVLPNSCRIGSGSSTVRLDTEQAHIAAIIGGVAVQRGLPERAAVIATATAMQESKLRNLDYGDRDSLGVFQQRPSQGWGTVEQIRDPVHATEQFYTHLVRVAQYESRPLTQVAQDVQRSGFPEAYATHEGEATIIAAAFTGSSPRSIACRLNSTDSPTSASTIAADMNALFGVAATAADGRVSVSTASQRGAAAIAAWAVANASQYGITSVSHDSYTWTRSGGSSALEWAHSVGDGSGPKRTIVRIRADS